MDTNIIIDVTRLKPSQKHPTIFDAFDKIDAGSSVIIQNDHDPKPVYYQLLGLRGNCFTWSYIANGPEVWEVEIRKNTGTDGKITIGQIVSTDIRKAEVFKRLGIDFCCGGKKTLEQACAEHGLDKTEVLNELDSQIITNTRLDFDKWKLSFLADYIVNQHHAFVRENAPILAELANKVASKHGDRQPEMIIINRIVTDLLNELSTHMKKEESILFPYIKNLESGALTNRGFSSIQDPIWAMESDHDLAGKLIHEIKHLTNKYSVPESACNSQKLLMYKLEEFQNDLFQHIHLENNILFPKAIELEKNL